MRDVLRAGALIIFAAVLSACTTTRAYNHIDPQARSHMKTIDSVMISTQKEVGADIKVSNISSYIQGHFVPVLLDIGLNTYRSHKASRLIKPIHVTLADHDFTQDMKEQFNQALAESEMDGVKALKILRQEPHGFRAAYIRQSEADAVMFIDVKYAFTPSFDALNLTSRVMVFPVNPALSPYKEYPDEDNIIEYSDNIYRNQFSALMPISTPGTTSENGAAWADMPEEKLAGLMRKAAKMLADQIAIDLNTDDIIEDPKGDTDSELKDENEETADEPDTPAEVPA